MVNKQLNLDLPLASGRQAEAVSHVIPRSNRRALTTFYPAVGPRLWWSNWWASKGDCQPIRSVRLQYAFAEISDRFDQLKGVDRGRGYGRPRTTIHKMLDY